MDLCVYQRREAGGVSQQSHRVAGSLFCSVDGLLWGLHKSPPLTIVGRKKEDLSWTTLHRLLFGHRDWRFSPYRSSKYMMTFSLSILTVCLFFLTHLKQRGNSSDGEYTEMSSVNVWTWVSCRKGWADPNTIVCQQHIRFFSTAGISFMLFLFYIFLSLFLSLSFLYSLFSFSPLPFSFCPLFLFPLSPLPSFSFPSSFFSFPSSFLSLSPFPFSLFPFFFYLTIPLPYRTFPSSFRSLPLFLSLSFPLPLSPPLLLSVYLLHLKEFLVVSFCLQAEVREKLFAAFCIGVALVVFREIHLSANLLITFPAFMNLSTQSHYPLSLHSVP